MPATKNPFSREKEGTSTPRQLAQEAVSHFQRAGSHVGLNPPRRISQILSLIAAKEDREHTPSK